MEPLLRLRKIEEDKAMGELAKVIKKVNIHEKSRERAILARQNEMNDFSTKHSQEFQVDLYQIYDSYLERLDSQISQAKKDIEKLQPELKEEQKKVKEARIKKRVLELVRERKLESYKNELRKLERKQLEEINYLQNSNKNQNTEGEKSENTIYKGIQVQDHEFDEADETGAEHSAQESGDTEQDPAADYFKQLGIDT